MNAQLQQRAAAFFQDELGVSFETLLAPIPGPVATGKSIRAQGVYHAIGKARRQDDASLPMGSWEHDLKRADWDRVSALALDALAGQSKDMQLLAWLLEAQIHLRGFAAVAPCLVLLDTLCLRYWDTLHPQAAGADLEYRANIIAWLNTKLLPALRLVPLTDTGRSRDYAWTDWEQARRNEQLRVAVGSRDGEAPEGATSSELASGIAATPSPVFVWLRETLNDALAALTQLDHTLDQHFKTDAPSLGALAGLLEQIASFAGSELHKRGIRPQAEPVPAPPAALPQLVPQAAHSEALAGPIRDRADAYARLAESAEFLMRLEPHSPVPYMVKRAIEWGSMNTAELYQELFLRLNGQLNIFEMLGLTAAPAAEA